MPRMRNEPSGAAVLEVLSWPHNLVDIAAI
jgi:hypothetical protein